MPGPNLKPTAFPLPNLVYDKPIISKGFTVKGDAKAKELTIKVDNSTGRLDLAIADNTLTVTSYDRLGDTELKTEKYKLSAAKLSSGKEIYNYSKIIIDGGVSYTIVANKAKGDTTEIALGPNQKGLIKASGDVFKSDMATEGIKVININLEKTPVSSLLRSMRNSNRELASA